LQRLVDALGAPFLILDSSAFTQPVSARLSRMVGYVDPEPPDPVRRVAVEYRLAGTGRPVALLDQELVLPAPHEGWAVTLGGGGLFDPDGGWELWDDAGSHVKTFRNGELPLALTKQTGPLRVAVAVDPEAADLLTFEAGGRLLRPLQPDDRQLLRR
jgi:hypothetical protein